MKKPKLEDFGGRKVHDGVGEMILFNSNEERVDFYKEEEKYFSHKEKSFRQIQLPFLYTSLAMLGLRLIEDSIGLKDYDGLLRNIGASSLLISIPPMIAKWYYQEKVLDSHQNHSESIEERFDD